MNEIYVSQAITIIIMLAGFIGNALYIRGNFGARIHNTEEDIKDLKANVRYKDTCDSKTHEFDGRIKRLETISNGK